jgi:MIP family channel proteins
MTNMRSHRGFEQLEDKEVAHGSPLVLSEESRSVIGEFLGCFGFYLIVVGSAQYLTSDLEIAAAQSFGLVVMVYLFLPVSGAHLNPIISLAQFLLGKMPVWKMIAYISVQCLASTCVAAICSAYEPHVGDVLGTNHMPAGTTELQAFLCETFLSCFLATSVIVFGIEHINHRGKAQPHSMMPVIVGFVLFSNLIWGSQVSGACMNPARAFGPALIDSGLRGDGYWVFFTAPFAGSVAAVLLWKLVLGPAHRKSWGVAVDGDIYEESPDPEKQSLKESSPLLPSN